LQEESDGEVQNSDEDVAATNKIIQIAK